jgi:hypothetical protein
MSPGHQKPLRQQGPGQIPEPRRRCAHHSFPVSVPDPLASVLARGAFAGPAGGPTVMSLEEKGGEEPSPIGERLPCRASFDPGIPGVRRPLSL